MAYDANGNEVGRYDKIHLVPWGEYVPYPKVFFFAKKLTGKVAHFTPGTVRNVSGCRRPTARRIATAPPFPLWRRGHNLDQSVARRGESEGNNCVRHGFLY